MDNHAIKLLESETGRVICERLELATTFWRRFLGLQFRRQLPPGHGILLAPCPSVHTCFLRFSIDVVLVDRHGTVVAVRKNVRPWGMVWSVRGGFAVLELPASTCDLAVGEKVSISGLSPLPASLQGWQQPAS